jgi:hypothetical protein
VKDETGPYARRIGSRIEAAQAPRGGRIWGLRLLPSVFVFPTLAAFPQGNPAKLVAMLAGIGLIVLAGVLVRRGLDATADYEKRRFAKAPPPFRLAGALAIGLAFLAISCFATGYGLFMGIVFGGLGVLACLATYGMDPATAKSLDQTTAQRAGVRTEQVIEAIAEAERKIADIKEHAASIANRELKGRIERIVDRAHGVLDEIERDPKDLSRARRFLNVYLDGTRNVIRDYAKRERDFAETAVADNFKSVLGTIEQVFEEQIDHLKKDETLDLEVAIDVLNTQLTKEGVG